MPPPARTSRASVSRRELDEPDAIGIIRPARRQPPAARAASCRCRPDRRASGAACLASSRLTSFSSRSRPMNDVTCCGRLFGVASSERRAGKALAQRGMQDLEDLLGAREVAQTHASEIAQRDVRGQPVAHQHGHCLRDEHLPAVRGAHDACRPVDGPARRNRCRGARRHPRAARSGRAAPRLRWLPGRRAPAAARASHRSRRAGRRTPHASRRPSSSRRGRDGVAPRPAPSASWRASAARIALGRRFPEAGAPLDVGEKERYGGRRCLHCVLIVCRGTAIRPVAGEWGLGFEAPSIRAAAPRRTAHAPRRWRVPGIPAG